MGGAAGGAFPGFDFNQMGGFNPYMFGYPPTTGAAAGMGMPAAPASWGFPGAMGGAGMTGSAASFHAPGAKNEIKLFVGGLQFQTLGMCSILDFINILI